MSGVAPLAEPAFAGAWSKAADAHQTISSVSRETAALGEIWRAESFTEMGFGDGWGANFKLENEMRTELSTDDSFALRLGLQKSMPIGERGAVAIMMDYLGGEAFEGVNCPGNGVEMRGAAGTSFSVLGREGFVSLEGGWRERGPADCDRLLGEAGAGLEFVKGWTILAKSWMQQGPSDRTAKIEATLLHDFGPLSVGLGWREGVFENAKERGWVISVWRQY